MPPKKTDTKPKTKVTIPAPKVSVNIRDELFYNLKTRTIYLSGEIDASMAAKLIWSLVLLNQDSREHINIFINSDGGEVHESYVMLDAIFRSKSPVNLIATGRVESAAAELVAFGPKKRRFATPNTYFMFHSSSMEYGEADSKKQKSRVLWDDKIEDDTIKKLAKIMRKKPKSLAAKINDELYLTVKEAIRDHIIDGVWPPPK